MDDAPVPTEFARPPEAVRPTLLGLRLSLLTIVVGIGLLLFVDEDMYFAAAVTIVGVIATGLSWRAAKRQQRPLRVRFLPYGVSVETERRPLEVPWSAVDSVFLAEHRLRGADRPTLGLCAVPVPAVDPRAGGLDRLWSAEDGCWVLCEPHLVNRPPGTLTAAVRQVAPDKLRPSQNLG